MKIRLFIGKGGGYVRVADIRLRGTKANIKKDIFIHGNSEVFTVTIESKSVNRVFRMWARKRVYRRVFMTTAGHATIAMYVHMYTITMVMSARSPSAINNVGLKTRPEYSKHAMITLVISMYIYILFVMFRGRRLRLRRHNSTEF